MGTSKVGATYTISAGTAIFLASILYFANVSPWPFFGLSALVFFIRCLRYWSPGYAFAVVTASTIGIVAIFQYLTPYSGLGLQVSNFVLIAAADVYFLWATRTASRENMQGLFELRKSNAFMPAAIVAGISAVFILWLQWSPIPHISFAMNGDAVWNTVTARFVIEDGGISSQTHPNPAPLTAELLASADAPGRALVDTSLLLVHDLIRQSQLWFVLLFITSVLIVVVVSPSAKGLTGWVAKLSLLCSGLLPFIWFYSGFAFFFGFYNASISVIVLLLSWIFWTRKSESPIATIFFLSVTSVVMMAVWAPLVLIPGALLIGAAVQLRKEMWNGQNRMTRTFIVAGLLLPLIYFLLFTLKDFMREGGALAVDGGIFQLSPYLLPGLLLVSFAVNFGKVTSILRPARVWGLILITVAAASGLAYLLWQRKGEDTLWGYYPVKYSWLVCCLIVVILIASAVERIQSMPNVRFQMLILGATATALFVGLAFAAKPLGPAELFSPIAVMTSKGVSSNDGVVGEISKLASREKLSVVSKYASSPAQDLFMNNWLLQLPVNRPDSLQRWYSYYLDGSDNRLLCQLSSDLKQPVTVVTRDALLESDLEQLCPGSNLTVEVVSS